MQLFTGALDGNRWQRIHIDAPIEALPHGIADEDIRVEINAYNDLIL